MVYIGHRYSHSSYPAGEPLADVLPVLMVDWASREFLVAFIEAALAHEVA
jgi:hypothetical protein